MVRSWVGWSSGPTSWHNRGFTKLAICTDAALDALVALANAVIVIRRLSLEVVPAL